jgi:hypothetical protein
VANRGKPKKLGGKKRVDMPLRPPQTSQLSILALNSRFHVKKLAFDRL